jgi:RNA polymerase sigma factor (sigma-70 family)
MEASALRQSAALPALAGRSPLLRLQSDERLIALTRRGHHGAFEALVQRYQPRLLAFCRRLVGSPQDAEDVLQEVFAAAHAAILADDRPISVRPWLYRIARNRAVNHLRRRLPAADGVDSMDVHAHENGTSTLERIQQREELRAIIADVHELPKTQRTALVLREIDDLAYGDIAQAMGKSLPSVKSLLIRARMSLAESSAGRAALAPLGLLALLRKLIPAKLGGGSSAGGTAGAVAASAGSAGSAGGVAGAAATGLGGALGAKAAVGVATAALITAGAMSVDEANLHRPDATARAGGTGISVITGAEDGFGFPAASPSAGPKVAADTARGAGSTAGAGPGRSPGSADGQRPVKPAQPAAPPGLLGGHQQHRPVVGGRHLGQASSAAGGLVPPLATPNKPAVASEGHGVSPKPPKIRVLPPSASPRAVIPRATRERTHSGPLDGLPSPLG